MLSVDVEESVGQRLEAADIFITQFHITIWQIIGFVRSQLFEVVRVVYSGPLCPLQCFQKQWAALVWSATNCAFVEKKKHFPCPRNWLLNKSSLPIRWRESPCRFIKSAFVLSSGALHTSASKDNGLATPSCETHNATQEPLTKCKLSFLEHYNWSDC